MFTLELQLNVSCRYLLVDNLADSYVVNLLIVLSLALLLLSLIV